MNGTMMILALAILAQPPADDDSSATAFAREKRERLLEFYTSEAAGYTFHRDAEHHEKLELRRKPVFVWNNVVRNNGQDGAVFVWTYRGRAEVIGTFFSLPENGLSALAQTATSATSSIRSRFRSLRSRAAPGRINGHRKPPASR